VELVRNISPAGANLLIQESRSETETRLSS